MGAYVSGSMCEWVRMCVGGWEHAWVGESAYRWVRACVGGWNAYRWGGSMCR